MKAGEGTIRGFLLHAPSWVLAGLMLAVTGWVGRETVAGQVAAGGVSVLLFVAVSSLSLARRRQAEIQRQAARHHDENALYQDMLGAVPGVVWRSDVDAARTFLSAGWQQITGISTDDALGEGWLEAVHEKDRARCHGAHRLASANREAFEVEYRLRRRDGAELWVVDRAAPRHDDDGTFLGFVGVTAEPGQMTREHDDVAGSTDGVLQLNESINEQALKLAVRYEDLERARDEAIDTEIAIKEYLAAFADEIGEPVGELANLIELIRQTDLDDQQLTYLRRAERATESLTQLHDRSAELLSRGTESETGEVGECELRPIVERIVDRQRSDATEKGFVTTFVIDDEVPALVKADGVRLRRMINDLWTAMLGIAGPGELTFLVKRDDSTSSPSMIHFGVSCDGEGVTDEQLTRAYYPAVSVHGEAAGLGLGPCKRLAEVMGGRMGVHRDETGAITFGFSVDLVDLNPNCDGRRVHGRLSQESVESNVGQVIDLSMGGMRVRCSKVPAGVFELELSDDEETIELKGEIAWQRRLGFRSYEIGVQFVDLDPDCVSNLSRLATRNRLRRILEAA